MKCTECVGVELAFLIQNETALEPWKRAIQSCVGDLVSQLPKRRWR